LGEGANDISGFPKSEKPNYIMRYLVQHNHNPKRYVSMAEEEEILQAILIV